jgi:dipeptidyl-peptidase-4
MIRNMLCVLLAGLIATAAQKKPVTLDAIKDVKPVPEPVWTPDNKRFAYVEDHVVWCYDAVSKSSKQLVSLKDLASEATPIPAQTQFSWQNRGVKEHTLQWMPDSKRLLISAGGDLFLLQVGKRKVVQLTATPDRESDPKLSPDGQLVAFRRNHDLFCLEINTRKTARLTFDGSPTLWNGELDWVYPEELGLESAYWWSPDSRYIAYLQFDVSREPLFPHDDLLACVAVYEPQRYPKAGDPNADVRLGVVSAAGGATRWMDVGETRNFLLARAYWAPDSKALFVERLNRVQNWMVLLNLDSESGARRQVLEETDPYWINVGDEFRFLNGGNEFLWASERDGFRHLYRYGRDGRLQARLTGGDWEVKTVNGVDHARRLIYFTSTEQSPLETHLYTVSFDGGERRRLTTVAGKHTIFMSGSCERYLDVYSNLSMPPRAVVFNSDAGEESIFREADKKLLDEYDILPTEILTVEGPGGATLYARLIRPAGFRSGQKYPAIVTVYGGPHFQAVQNAWKGLNWEQAMAHRGFVIWQLDNRGSSGRGHAWEASLFHRFGDKELQDQVAGIRHLIGMGFVDASRIGIQGWSYGGFLTLYALLYAPELFRAGIAGAPVTDWRNYDTIYTERYLGLPEDNEEGYRLSSPVQFARNLRADLLLVHNLEDDNVLFQNSVQFAAALQKEKKQFEWMIYPQKTHAVTGEARSHLDELMALFFEKRLKN